MDWLSALKLRQSLPSTIFGQSPNMTLPQKRYYLA